MGTYLIRLELDEDSADKEATKECVYAYLLELIENDSLSFEKESN
tara:strand:+ start:303 stop:437 length:135 start_codon:yes stop_codon:yes gene_type:complete